jgi:hypothetical protein
MPRLYFVRMTYLARVRLDRIRARWRRPRQRTATRTSAALPIETTSAPMGLAETIALAAAGKARLEVSTVGVTLPTAPAMQRWVSVERSPSDPLPTVAVIVQGHGRAVANFPG